MAKIVTFKLKSRENLISFLKKFLPIEKFILVELTKANMVCKVSTPDRSTVKYSKIALDNVLDGSTPGDIRIPMADASKVANILKKFAPADEIFIDVQYEEGHDDYLVATQLTFKTDKLKIKMVCGDILLSKFISPDVLKKIIRAGSDGKQIELPFKSEYFDEISSLCEIDIEKNRMKLRVDAAGKFMVAGSNFECELDIVPAPSEEVEFKMKINQLAYIDSELSSFEIGPNYLVIRSKDTDTITVMSNIED